MKIKIGGILGILLSAGLLFVAPAVFATEYSGSLSSGLESGMSGTVSNCSILSVSHGTVAAYPSCRITCDSGYKLSGSSCKAVSSGGGGSHGGSGSSGGGSSSSSSSSSSDSASSATGTVAASGGSVSLAASASSPSVKFVAPDGALGAAATITVAKVSNTSSSYVPPAGATGLFMVGGNAFQITAVSGSTAVTNFSKPITLTFTYTLAQIPAGVAEASLKIYYYDAAAKVWVEIPSTVNTVTRTITASVNHLTQFAIFGKKIAGAAANSAATAPMGNNAALIAQIQAQLTSLIAQLKAMVGDMIAQGKYVSPALMAFAPGNSATAATAKITQGWSFGQTGNEVKIIQTILAKDSSVYPEGLVTGYFGASTLAAVQKFQLKYGIAQSGDTGFGIVGPVTISKLNELAR